MAQLKALNRIIITTQGHLLVYNMPIKIAKEQDTIIWKNQLRYTIKKTLYINHRLPTNSHPNTSDKYNKYFRWCLNIDNSWIKQLFKMSVKWNILLHHTFYLYFCQINCIFLNIKTLYYYSNYFPLFNQVEDINITPQIYI